MYSIPEGYGKSFVSATFSAETPVLPATVLMAPVGARPAQRMQPQALKRASGLLFLPIEESS